MFLDLLIFFVTSLVNYVHTYVTFLVSYVLGLVVSPEEGNALLPKRSVLLWLFLWRRKDF